MAKVVPMVTATSMFEEPSSGSKTMAYLAAGESWRSTKGSSFSSEAMMPMLSRRERQWMSASLA